MEQSFQEVKFPMTGFYDIEWDNSYQCTLVQSYLGENVVNRWFYICAEPYVGALSSIADAFQTLWVTVLQNIQSTGLDYTLVSVTELFGERQTYQEAITASGAIDAGQDLPAFFGARYRLTPFNTRVRKGRKIFAGMKEGVVESNDIAAAYVSNFASVALAMNDVLTAEGQDLLPSLLSPANTKHTGNVITQITTAIWSGWSTQSSRKVGRGT
jgi:hypothetical protein